MRTSLAAGAIALGSAALWSFAAKASDPASQDVAMPTQAGASVVVEWTGTALPGASGSGTTGGVADEPQPCAPVGPDDSHTINLTGEPGDLTITADFHIDWQKGELDPSGTFTDPDMVLTVYKDTLDQQGYSDGGTPEENVGLTGVTAGTYNAVVCPFLSSKPVPYHAKLTVTALEPAACRSGSGNVVANASIPAGGSARKPDENGLGNFDVFQSETASRNKAIPTDLHGRYQSAIYDRTLGVPTFLWARTDAQAAAVGALAPRELLVEGARAHLRNEARELHLTAAMIDQARVTDAGFNGDGPAVVRFSQRVDGVEVYHRSLNVMLARDLRPVAVSGYFAPPSSAAPFTLGPAQAVAAAWTGLGGALDASALRPTEMKGDWQWFARPAVSGTHVFERGPRAKAVYYPRAGGLEPAYEVELFANARANGELLAYALVVSAIDSRVLHRENLKADAFSYRVYADAQNKLHQPFDSPLGNDYAPFRGNSPAQRFARIGTGSSLITLDNAGITTGDPWLAQDAASTSGNNVNACKDTYDAAASTPAGTIGTPGAINFCVDRLEPPTATTGDHAFDYDSAADADPATDAAVGHAIVNLFYMNNWLHDWWYNHGFDEAAGNAQDSNFGRGGVEGDAMQAQGQDGSGRNNANMATPSDGSSPIMQQYLFDGIVNGEVRITAPSDSGPLAWVAIHDAGSDQYDLTQSVALTSDGLGDSDTDGCGPAIPYPDAVVENSPVAPPLKATTAPPQPSLQGKIALIDRGTCNFTGKIQYAEASGAVGLVIANNADGNPPSNVGNGDIPLAPVQPTSYAYTIPTVMIRKDVGEQIKALINGGADVKIHMSRTPSIDVDGTRDNQIIAHEHFHYVHHRLTASSNRQSSAMSEGWGDTDAFMLTVRADDVLVPGNASWGGAYGLAFYVTDNSFAGIRRAPYTTDFAYNAFTLRNIADGQPNPDGSANTSNSEVHNAGEIWANEMFGCYAGVLRRHSFADARSRMQDYIIAGLKMTPADATYTEARDAVLSAALATDIRDYGDCAHGFAARGNGLNAVAPARASTDLTGVVEDYSEFVCQVGPRSLPEGKGLLVGAFGPGLLAPLFGLALLRRRRK